MTTEEQPPQSTHQGKSPEQPLPIGAPLPMYDPSNQELLADRDYFTVVNTERTRALREISVTSQAPRTFLGGDGLLWAMQHTNSAVGRHFQSHGLTDRLESGTPVESLDNLITNGIIKGKTFWTMPFSDVGGAGGFGADMPKTAGGIIVVGDYDKYFPIEGPANIRYVVLGEEYMRVLNVIENRYTAQGIQVIPWHDAPKILTEEVNKHSQTSYTYETVDPSQPIRYPPVKNRFRLPSAHKEPQTQEDATPAEDIGPVW